MQDLLGHQGPVTCVQLVKGHILTGSTGKTRLLYLSSFSGQTSDASQTIKSASGG
jgi:hypothetical protein